MAKESKSFVELGANLASVSPIRNVIVPYDNETIEAFRQEHVNTDVFCTVYSYDREEIRQAQQQAPFYVDLDGKYAQSDLRALMDFLIKNDCPKESIQVFFSGNKGFHLLVPFEALNILPDEELNKSYDKIAKELKKELFLSSLDKGIYDNVRLFRLSNSINSKSGLYKIPLTHEELELPLEQIKEFAKTPRNEFAFAKPQIWSEFRKLYQKAKKIAGGSKTGNIFDPVEEGERNTITFKRAVRLKGEGKALDEAIQICLSIKDTPPLPEWEIERTVASAYQEKYVVDPVSNTPKEVQEIQKSFLKTQDGLLCEEVYDEELGEPLFAIYDGSEITYKSSVAYRGGIVYPISGAIVTSKTIKLPTKAATFGSDTELLAEIKSYIHKYVDIEKKWENWAAYYILLSWLYDKLPVCPYLSALGASDSGKTRFVQVVGSVCYKPFTASGSITASPIFRTLDQFRGTLIVNEFDHIGSFNDEIIVILNNGFEENLPVIRTEGEEKKDVRVFHVFGPKLFSARKRKSDWAFESRLITIPMKQTHRNDIPPFLLADFHREAQALRNKLLMFRFVHYSEEVVIRNDLFTGIKGRLRQTLLSVTSVINDDQFLIEAQAFAKQLEQELITIKGFDLDTVIYQTLRESFENGDDKPEIKDIVKRVKEIADIEKLSSKAVGNIVRDELGFRTNRGGGKGNYVIHITKSELDALKERYETDENTAFLEQLTEKQTVESTTEDTEVTEHKSDTDEI